MITKAVKPRPKVDRLALLLIIGVVSSAAWSIAAADWMPRLDLLGMTVVASILLGTLIATRPWRARTAHLIMLLYGVAWVMLIVLDQLPDKVFGWTGLDTLRYMIVRFGEHIYIWLQAAVSGGVGRDNTMFLMFLVAVFWLIAYIAVWNTFRQQHMWRAVAPAGVALLINTYYYGGPQSLYMLLILYLFCVLLYAARMYTLKQEERWHFGRIRFNPEIKRDFLQIGGGIALAAVVFGAVAPSVVGAPQISDLWREISRPMRSVEESFNRLFAGLQPHGLAFANPFGRTLALLGERNLGNELVMEVRAPEGRYWQAVVYDEYGKDGWQSTETTRVAIAPNDQPYSTDYELRVPITQTFTVYFPNNALIFAAPQPVSVNRPAFIEAFPGTTDHDFAMWTTITPMGENDSYQVVSSQSRASIDLLRAAGTTYPDSIRARYLQVPASLPDRVKQLARKIVSDAQATTPYDQATALELWLHTNVKYNEKIPAPPPGRDGVDYVLFDTKEGYCDYYASAMAMMARSLGLPARIASGYTSGTYDANRNIYQVYQFNAHTWTEVYFPKYGWIQFEPTASQPAIDRPLSSTQSSTADPGVDEQGNPRKRHLNPLEDQEFDPMLGSGSVCAPDCNPVASTEQSPAGPTVALLIAGLVLLIAAIAAVAMWTYENRGSSRQMHGGEWVFARLARMARWLRVRLAPSQTPYEQAQALSQIIPHHEPAIERVASLYVLERYGRTPTDLIEARTTWRSLRRPMWWTGFKRRLPHSLPSPRKLFRRKKSDRV